MLLAIDIGNTNVVIGLFKGNKLFNYFRVSTLNYQTFDEAGILLRQLVGKAKMDDVILCSVVPPLTHIYQKGCEKYFKKTPLVVSSDLPLGIKILYEDPRQVGADRLANVVAAYKLFGGPIIIVDLGTATTFDVVSEKGEYLGGAIAPGIEISTSYLFQKAAQLFKVRFEKPKEIIGKNTEESLKSGILYSAVGGIDEVVKRIKKKLMGKVKVIATGGLAELVFSESETIQKTVPTLTLEGLKIIYDNLKKI
jgi:type III pantothenate kinase